MTTWTRTKRGLEATINGKPYLIEKVVSCYFVNCDDIVIRATPYHFVSEAKAAAEAHAAGPAPAKQGVHMSATQGQWMVDDLKRSFTTAQIQDFIDASPFDEPDTGAPEGGPVG